KEAPEHPTVGFLARLIPGKGLGLVVDAFIELHRRGRVPTARLHCAGTLIEGDVAFVEAQKVRLEAAGLAGASEFSTNISREEKERFLRGLSLLSVPAIYGEAFGLYLLEALACGVPVVQPRVAAFPEIVEATGGGVLVEPDSALALALAWEALLLEPERARALGLAGMRKVREAFSMERMAERFLEVSQRALHKQV
ncbi:MAG: glycosyltransferase family 4 protein, partial [Chthoniobacteraceae bacterium]|nr:glycosyltransferase family 4 protein [Chthoniobacteraceae bacterium]